jgi:hypothetical protein
MCYFDRDSSIKGGSDVLWELEVALQWLGLLTIVNVLRLSVSDLCRTFLVGQSKLNPCSSSLLVAE